MKPKKVFCIFFVLLCWVPQTTSAYFADNQLANDGLFEELLVDISTVGSKQSFFIPGYKEIGKSKVSAAVVLPNAEYFVPIDEIPYHYPVYDIFDYPKPVDISISNLIYANLRLRRLLSEYDQLQKNFEDIVESGRNLSAVLTEADSWADGISGSVDGRSQLQRKGSHSKKSAFQSIFREWKNVNKGNERLGRTRKDSPAAISDGGIEEYSVNTIRRMISSGNIKSLSLHYGIKTVDVRMPQAATPPLSVGSDNDRQAQGADLEPKKPRNVDIDEASRPWIDRFFIKLYRYASQNKVESIILFLILIGMLTLISAILQK